MAKCATCGADLPGGAQYCPVCAAPVAAAGPREERKLATVLFGDLVGSTQLADAEDPERTRALLDRFYDAMAAEIELAGGTVEKFVGDAVMAAFGAPTAQEDHAERALHAALAMQRRMTELFDEELGLRIGVNTGEVVVGEAREGGSFVSGDAVNVGARLEQAAAAGEILVGERTAAVARCAFEFTEPTTVPAKGKAGGVACRRLVRALSLMRPRGVSGMRRAFVGRATELARLQDAYRSALSSRKPRLVTILGDAGVGKTRLARELWEWLGVQDPAPLRRTGRCLSYGNGLTYWPLAEVLREHFGLLESDPPTAVAERVERHPFLGLTLGLDVEQGLHPLIARERLHDAWLAFVDELVQEGPVVVLIEDVHWAEDDLFDVLSTLLRHVDGPLLLLTTARPELVHVRPAWGADTPDASRLRLEALAENDTERLLDMLLGAELPDALRTVVLERAEGNPFFVEELVATLVDRGMLRQSNGGWSFGELPANFRVPDSVQALLAARIDLLPAAEKAALQAASVIGRVFWTGPVYELVGGAEPDLELLEERDFIRRRSGSGLAGEREYAIKHALTREVAYASLPKAVRAHRHAAFARWLERTGEGRDEHAPMLAHHFAEAVRPEDLDLAWPGRDDEARRLRERAVLWSRRAATLAIGRYEIEDSVALLRRAVELEADPHRKAELWQEIGHANALRFDGDAFREAMERAIELAGPSAELYTELALQTARRSGMWKRQPDRELVDEWVDRALELAQEGTPTQARALAAVALWRNDESAARSLHAIAERMGDADLRSSALAALADVAWAAGDLAGARPWIEERLAILPQLSDPDDRHFAQMTGVAFAVATGAISTARDRALAFEEMVEGLTPHHRFHGVSGRVSVESLAGRWDEVRALTARAEHRVDANRDTPCPSSTSTLLSCALASEIRGDTVEARRLEAEAEQYSMAGFGWYYEPPRLRLALARDDVEQLRQLVASFVPRTGQIVFHGAAALLDALVALNERERIEAEAPQWARPGTYVEPFALRALAFAREDEALLAAAAARYEAMGLEWDAEKTRRLFSQADRDH